MPCSRTIISGSSWPIYSPDEITAVARVLKSGKVNYWTGEEARHFEQEYAAHCDVPFAVAIANGSVALELALKAIGVGPGDEVIVPSRTFVATASSVALVGARPIFADVDRVSQNITAETLEAVVTARTRAVIVVHLAGWPCEVQSILELAKLKNLAVVEDCAQGHGALYRGRPVGSFGDAAIFSFCQDKIISTGGEGGMLVTRDRDIWHRAWSYKDHGKNYAATTAANAAASRKFRWLHDTFGTNWRMTEMQAVIGRLQLKKLDHWIEHRSSCASYLNSRLRHIEGIRTTEPPHDVRHSYYKYYAFIEPERLKPKWNRDRIVKMLVQQGFFAQPGSCSEVYRERSFKRAKMQPPSRHPVARELGKTSFLTLVDPTVTPDLLERLSAALEVIMDQALQQ
jgi:hypothetical protein